MDIEESPNWRILHIDDDADDRRIVQSMLDEARGRIITVDWAKTLDEGRDKLCTNLYDAVLIDYDFGSGSGIDLIREFVDRGYSTPMILLTGRGSYEVDMEAMRAGATIYLNKNEINSLLLERSIRYAIERNQAKAALLERDRRLSVALEAAQLGTWTYTYVDRILDLDERSRQMYRTDQPRANHDRIIQDFIHPDDATFVKEALRKSADPAGSGRFQAEYRILQPDGSVHWLSAWALAEFEGQGEDRLAVRLIGASRDITKEKQSGVALVNEQARLEAILQSLPVGVWITDEHGRVLETNPMADIIWAGKADLSDAVEWNNDYLCWRADTGEPVSVGDLPLSQVLRTGRPIMNFEMDIQRLDGSRGTILSAAAPVKNSEGRLIGVVSSAQDITERKKAEQALRISEERYQLASRAVAGVLYDLSIDRNEMYQSEGLERVVGYRPGEEPGDSKTWWPRNIHPDDYLRIQTELQAAIEGRTDSFAYEYRIRHRDGHWVYIWDQGHIVRDINSQAQRVVGFCTDITERKQAEQAVRQRERKHRELAEALEVERAKLAAAIENLPVGIGIGNAAGRTISLNSAGLKLHGFNNESEMFSSLENYVDFFELVYLDGREMPVEEWPVSRALRGEFVRDFELCLRNKRDGSEHIVMYSVAPINNSAGETVLIVYVIQDMTERKQAEQALRESEERFRQLANAMPQLVWTAFSDSKVDYYNQRKELYSGVTTLEGNLWEWQPIVHPDDLQSTVAAWQEAVRTTSTYQIEHRIRMADGSYRWHLSRGKPAYEDQGKLVKWYGTATDIHDLKQAQAELAEYAEKLKLSNDDLENFALVASHDLQEPLRKILGFGNSLRKQLENKQLDETLDYLTRMQSAAERMHAMINGLLDLSRVNTSSSKFETVDLTNIAEVAVSDLENRIQSTGGEVIIRQLPTIVGDALQLRQLLQNLIVNGLKFHKAGIHPVVMVSGELLNSGTMPIAKIVVEDNGIGFESADAEKIFQPFGRLHGRSEYDGSGMGLAICRKIAERHGGIISASSRPGEGSIFTVFLPVSENAFESTRKVSHFIQEGPN